MNVITPVANTQTIRIADFVRVNTGTNIYRFATTASTLTIPAVDAEPFGAVGQLLGIGTVQRDLKSTANETNITLTGIDTTLLGWALSQQIKGASVQMWHGFFDANGALITTGGTGGLYQFFYGQINSFAISEQWMEEVRDYVGTITVSAASIQLILQNRIAGRYTNNQSWQYYTPGDTSMIRTGTIENINYPFGRD